MARSADALSVFVVQRSFRRVLRGYDPDEVEHHLERVSRWFSESGVGQVARDAEAKLQERDRAVREAEAKAQRRVEDADRQAQATLAAANAEAATIASQHADAAEQARRQSESLVEQARRQSQTLVDDGRRDAEAIRGEALAQSVRL